MDLPEKLLEKTSSNTRSKIEKHMLTVMDKSIHEEHLSQPLQTNDKQINFAVSLSTNYNGNLWVTSQNKKFYFTVSINDDDFK